MRIEGSRSVYSKLMLPKFYNKSTSLETSSELFQYISNDVKKGKITKFSEEQPKLMGKANSITVASDSINKVITRYSKFEEYLLLSDRIF